MGHSELDGLRNPIYQLNGYSSTPRHGALLDKASRFTYSSSCLSLFFRIPLHEGSVAAFETLSGPREPAADAILNGKAEDRAREMRMCCKTPALSMHCRTRRQSNLPFGEQEQHHPFLSPSDNPTLPADSNCGIVSSIVTYSAIPHSHFTTVRPSGKKPMHSGIESPELRGPIAPETQGVVFYPRKVSAHDGKE